jgi:hypothetical protein
MTDGTTVWIDKETREDLQKLAQINERSVAGQIRWMVKRDLAALNETQQSEPEKSSEQSGQ